MRARIIVACCPQGLSVYSLVIVEQLLRLLSLFFMYALVLACNKIADSKDLGSLELTLTLPAWLSRIRLVVLKYTFFSLSLFQS